MQPLVSSLTEYNAAPKLREDLITKQLKSLMVFGVSSVWGETGGNRVDRMAKISSERVARSEEPVNNPTGRLEALGAQAAKILTTGSVFLEDVWKVSNDAVLAP